MTSLKPTMLAILREHSPVDVLHAMADILGDQAMAAEESSRRRGIMHCVSPGAPFFGAASVVADCARKIADRNWPLRTELCEPLRNYDER